MALLTRLVRRSLWLLLIGLAAGAAVQWWRERQAPRLPAAPEWPPIRTDAGAESATAGTAGGPDAGTTVRNLVDVPADPSDSPADGSGAANWVEPDDEGQCPIGHPVKANDNSGIFHVPGGRFYDRTKAERCYVDAEAAAADGYRRAKS
ncbi:MAG: hypothetical protein AAFP84_11485 [Actinomycetota bacterium]